MKECIYLIDSCIYISEESINYVNHQFRLILKWNLTKLLPALNIQNSCKFKVSVSLVFLIELLTF
jgi:hypothetical protein